MLYEAGIDVVNIADGPRAVARMGPAALSHLQQKTPSSRPSFTTAVVTGTFWACRWT